MPSTISRSHRRAFCPSVGSPPSSSRMIFSPSHFMPGVCPPCVDGHHA